MPSRASHGVCQVVAKKLKCITICYPGAALAPSIKQMDQHQPTQGLRHVKHTVAQRPHTVNIIILTRGPGYVWTTRFLKLGREKFKPEMKTKINDLTLRSSLSEAAIN